MGADGREKVGDDAVEPFDLARADSEGFRRAIDDLRRFELLDLPADELQVDGQGIQRFPSSWATPAASVMIEAIFSFSISSSVECFISVTSEKTTTVPSTSR